MMRCLFNSSSSGMSISFWYGLRRIVNRRGVKAVHASACGTGCYSAKSGWFHNAAYAILRFAPAASPPPAQSPPRLSPAGKSSPSQRLDPSPGTIPTGRDTRKPALAFPCLAPDGLQGKGSASTSIRGHINLRQLSVAVLIGRTLYERASTSISPAPRPRSVSQKVFIPAKKFHSTQTRKS